MIRLTKPNLGQTALMFAASCLWGKPIEQGGSTAAQTTAPPKAGDLIPRLIDGGADIEAADFNGRTALHYAAKSASNRAIQLLLKAGANVNARGECGKTTVT